MTIHFSTAELVVSDPLAATRSWGSLGDNVRQKEDELCRVPSHANTLLRFLSLHFSIMLLVWHFRGIVH